MTIEEAIHQRWAASTDLNNLPSAERLFTGRAHGGSLPYATLVRESSRPVCRTSGGDVEEVALRIYVWHDDYEAGQAIVRRAEAVFGRCSFALGDGGRVSSMRPGRRTDRQHEDGRWQFTLRFLAQVFYPKEPQ
ncbi:MAG: DUF3168 domain-containing protein [Pirellulales bacterium]|nr:DUF3168 domain-containing protein [Pirellulales bacterium]